jgi:predicted DCC family thiol-disulfide oxidoreductase YuxK
MRKGRDPLSPDRGKEPGKAFLLYDGDCSVCRNAVEWIRARAAPDTFEYLSCHSEDLPRRFPHIDKSACLTAMHLILQDGSVLAGERAIPEILLRLRRLRWAAALFRLPFAGSLSRAFYRRFAARRHDVSRLLFPGEKR